MKKKKRRVGKLCQNPHCAKIGIGAKFDIGFCIGSNFGIGANFGIGFLALYFWHWCQFWHIANFMYEIPSLLLVDFFFFFFFSFFLFYPLCLMLFEGIMVFYLRKTLYKLPCFERFVTFGW